jgi:hypothetical protein
MAPTPWDIEFLRTFTTARDKYSQELQDRVDVAHLRDPDNPMVAYERARRDKRIFNEFLAALTYFKENGRSLSSLNQVFDGEGLVEDLYLFRRHPWEAYFLYIEPAAGSKERPKLSGVVFCHESDSETLLGRYLTEEPATE